MTLRRRAGSTGWRLTASAIGAIVCFAFPGGALARPQLLVTGPAATAASGTTTLELKGVPADAAWAEVTTYVPSGYTVDLGHGAGTRIGSVQAQAQSLEFTPIARATGVVLVADRKDPSVRQSATACTHTAEHAAVWLLRMAVSTHTIDIPVYVDPTTGGDAGFGSAKLVMCLPQPYAKFLPSYAPLGAKLSDLKTTLSAGLFTNPRFPGRHVWRTVVTPWRPDGSAADLASTVEAQGLVGVPASLTLKAKVQTRRLKVGRVAVRNSVLLSGMLLQSLRGVAGATVTFFANDRSAGAVATNASGAFARKRPLVQRTTFRITATVPTLDTPCVNALPPTLAPAGCVAATRAAYRLRSDSVVVAPRTR